MCVYELKKTSKHEKIILLKVLSNIYESNIKRFVFNHLDERNVIIIQALNTVANRIVQTQSPLLLNL